MQWAKGEGGRKSGGRKGKRKTAATTTTLRTKACNNKPSKTGAARLYEHASSPGFGEEEEEGEGRQRKEERKITVPDAASPLLAQLRVPLRPRQQRRRQPPAPPRRPLAAPRPAHLSPQQGAPPASPRPGLRGPPPPCASRGSPLTRRSDPRRAAGRTSRGGQPARPLSLRLPAAPTCRPGPAAAAAPRSAPRCRAAAPAPAAPRRRPGSAPSRDPPPPGAGRRRGAGRKGGAGPGSAPPRGRARPAGSAATAGGAGGTAAGAASGDRGGEAGARTDLPGRTRS
ncbi:translation initiation factor IF-2-like [Strigops habroptila]|uniref:translation initiation factor IF-2-like n=1 Tax=Strigops habroptila TaxID=2489341 RepID=UPI0011CF9F0F|nr:translation initiation factor IF-2-like [Strigops habroptila]